MMSELKLLRAIWEIRYPASAHFFDNRGKIASRWHLDHGLEHWNIAQNHVRLHSKDNSVSFLVEHHRMVFDAEGWDINDFCTSAASITSWVTRLLKIKKVERLGFRIYQISERESFEEVRRSMTNKLFALTKTDWEVFGGEPLDVVMPLTLAFGNRKANFKMGPMLRKEYKPLLQSEKMLSILPEASIFIDFDLYQTKPVIESRDIRREYYNRLTEWGRLMQKVSRDILDHFGGFADEQ